MSSSSRKNFESTRSVSLMKPSKRKELTVKDKLCSFPSQTTGSIIGIVTPGIKRRFVSMTDLSTQDKDANAAAASGEDSMLLSSQQTPKKLRTNYYPSDKTLVRAEIGIGRKHESMDWTIENEEIRDVTSSSSESEDESVSSKECYHPRFIVKCDTREAECRTEGNPSNAHCSETPASVGPQGVSSVFNVTHSPTLSDNEKRSDSEAVWFDRSIEPFASIEECPLRDEHRIRILRKSEENRYNKVKGIKREMTEFVDSVELSSAPLQQIPNTSKDKTDSGQHIFDIKSQSCKTDSSLQKPNTDNLEGRIWVRVQSLVVIFFSFLVLLACIRSMDKFVDLSHIPLASSVLDALWNDQEIVGAESVYVPGAGFSGFWFTLGRLQSVNDPSSKEYYCFSAGCLGVVATLTGQTVEEMADMALGVQQRWKEGEIGLFDVVENFVDELLPYENKVNVPKRSYVTNEASSAEAPKRLSLAERTELLSKIHVVTTVKATFGLTHIVRNPKNVDELREMLVQTAWIPFATGRWFWTRDSQTGDWHLDGAFSVLSHPKCTYHLGLPLKIDLFMNSLNVNLSKEKAIEFWKAGIKHGL